MSIEYGLETLLSSAKDNGFAAGYSQSCIYFKFGNKQSGAGVNYRTGLYLPPNTILTGGFVRTNVTVAGSFGIQLNTAADVADPLINPVAGSFTPLVNRAFTPPDAQRELILNIGGAITAGEFVVWLEHKPFNCN